MFYTITMNLTAKKKKKYTYYVTISVGLESEHRSIGSSPASNKSTI